MKHRLLFILALLCAVAQGVQAKNTVHNLSTLAWSGETMILVAEDGDELTGSIRIDKDHRIKWEIADGASITLNNVNIEGTPDYIYVYWDYTQFVSDFAGITCLGNATITLVGENKVKGGGPYNPGIQPGPEGTTLTIKGTGSLYADCCGCGPGIGSKAFYEKCGNISIEGGTITAIGGTDGQQGSAGIGAGYETSCGDITFKNCTVEARGGYHSAGIGKSSKYNSPSNTQCGVISIEEGANITAYGGEKAAGIGGGSEFPGCETRIYAGSVVKAYGGKYGAGIGGGYDAGGGPLWISGGYVEAHGGTDAAGIGGGETGNSGDIVINGGTIYAYGNGYGVGIGAGEDGDVAAEWSSISINGGFIHAEGGEDIGRAIGGEDDEDYNVNVLSFGPGMYAYVPLGSPFPDVPLYYFERNTNLMNSRVVEIKPCEHSGQTLSYARVDDYKHRFYCKWCGFMEESHTGEFSCTKCNYEGTPQTVHYYEMVYNEQKQKYEYQMVATETFKNGLILPSHKGTVPDDRIFVAWVTGVPDANDDGILKEAFYFQYSSGQYISTDATELNFKARYVNKTLDLATVQSNQKLYNGMIVTGTLNTASYPVKITIDDGATVTLRNANISGVNNESYSWAGITCEGSATIILEGTNTVKGFYENYPGLFVPATSILTIDGEGSLNASSNGFGAGIGGGYYGDACGVININGGNITATGGKYAAGIGSSHRNSCSNIIVSGGTINATGGEHAAGIGSGWGGINAGSSCGMINILSDVTSVTATKGAGAPNSIGAGYQGTCSVVAIGSKVGAVERSPYFYFPLANASSNSTKISAFNGEVCDVTLKGRTLYKDDSWNTLCLPFSISDFSGTPLAGATVKTLESTSFDSTNGALTLNFTEANLTAIEAGKPYIVKWASGDNIENPMFTNVTITATTPTDITPTGSGSDGSVTFKGTFGPHDIGGTDGDNTKLYLGNGNKLYWPSGAKSINAFRAYFQLNDNIAPSSAVRAFVLNFDGDEETGIATTNYTDSTDSDNAWYDLSGRKLSGKPTTKGLYINKGKMIVIK